VALVTGFSKGLGWAMAQSLADAHVAICGIVSRDLLHLTGHDWSAVIKADLTTSFHLAKETSPLMGRASALPMSSECRTHDWPNSCIRSRVARLDQAVTLSPITA
jgi:NAD(P)-dependent dehydrogenase (short-subunit alcohol dehydrogenase family)